MLVEINYYVVVSTTTRRNWRDERQRLVRGALEPVRILSWQ